MKFLISRLIGYHSAVTVNLCWRGRPQSLASWSRSSDPIVDFSSRFSTFYPTWKSLSSRNRPAALPVRLRSQKSRRLSRQWSNIIWNYCDINLLDYNYRWHDGLWRFFDSGQKWFKPLFIRFNVWIEESQNISGRHRRSMNAGSDQTFPFIVSQQSNFLNTSL